MFFGGGKKKKNSFSVWLKPDTLRGCGVGEQRG